MITTIYKCDKCGNEQDTDEQFWTVGITARTKWHRDMNDVVKSIHVCRPCLESFGIYVQKKKDEPLPEPPTVEELIREIIARCSDVWRRQNDLS